MNLSISEQLCYSTVRIACGNKTKPTSTGTGFFFRFIHSELKQTPVIITNKHVVEGFNVGSFSLTECKSDNTPNNLSHIKVDIEDLQSFIKYHPDPSVDLCAIPLAELIRQSQARGITIFNKYFDINVLPTKEQLSDLTAIEDIIMIGYPNGIWDSVNNMPIIRRGITATHPRMDYRGKKEFVIDAACFPGSSGSPVIIYNPSGYTTSSGGNFFGVSRVLLMGVLFAGPQYTTSGELVISDVPASKRAIPITNIPNNLGYVIKSERILELQSLFE